MAASTLEIGQTEKQARVARKDPPPRRLDGFNNSFALRKQDPTREYRWVNKLDTNQGIEYYVAIGYEPVPYDPERGVQVVGGSTSRTKGEPIERMGQVLMSTPIENAARIHREGPDGSSGQDAADRLQDMIRRPEYVQTAGLGPNYVVPHNSTTKLAYEGE